MKTKNSSVLILSDMHIPFNHQDLLPFLKAVKKKYKPDRVICIGDEIDSHAMSFHDSDPDLMSAGDELRAARKIIKEVEKLFPKMDLVDSNHGSLYYRKAKAHGIPKCAILPYNDLLGVGKGWKWHQELTIKLSNGQQCYFHHGRSADVVKTATSHGMPAVQGHYHEKFKIEYWGNTLQLAWGMSVGCLIDDESFAMAYNNTNLKRPVIGLGMIVNGLPELVPLIKNKNGRWKGKL